MPTRRISRLPAATLGEVTAVVAGAAGAAYEPGLLALRGGCLLEGAVRALPQLPDALLVNATGRDHPRRAGLALQLGAVLDLPTVGVTHRSLLAAGEWPEDERAARSPLVLAGDVVGYWLRTSPGARPLAIHAAWRTDPDTGLAEAPVRARARLGMVVSAGALYPWRQVPRAGCPGRLRRVAGRRARWRSDDR